MCAIVNQRRNFVNKMSPRNYDMGKRGAAVERTRRRIVDATRALHGERGIAATSWEDIAARAGVGVGTVYRHFPSVDELIPACGRATMEEVALPDPEAAPALFADTAGDEARLARLAREAFGIYERGAPQLRAARRERDVHPAVRESADALEASLAALVAAGLEPLEPTEEDRRVARALLDLGTWEALREQGLDQQQAVAAVSGLLVARLGAA